MHGAGKKRGSIHGSSEKPDGGAPTSESARIPQVEALRGIAITLVVLLHAQGWVSLGPRLEGWSWPLGAFLVSGHTGVSLFFVLSAFLLARPFVAERHGGPAVNVAAFYRRRARRILPLYTSFVVLAALVLLDSWGELGRALPYLFFLNSLPNAATPLEPFSTVWWSLATEVQFYLLLPLLPCLLRAGRRGGAVVAGSVAVLLYAAFLKGWLPLGFLALASLGHSVVGRLPLFACGALVAFVSVRFEADLSGRVRHHPLWRNGGADLLLFAALLALALLLRNVGRMGYWAAEVGWPAWHLAEGLLWSVVLMALLWLPLRSHRLLCNPVWTAIGTISYSIYLWHNPLLVYGLRHVTPDRRSAWMPLVLMLTLLLSRLTYVTLERPFLRRPGPRPPT